VLRKLGVECDGAGFGEDFHWVVKRPDGRRNEIVPDVKRPGASRHEDHH
jgi:hypothetical protein